VRPRQKFPYTEWEDYRAGLFGLTWGGSSADALDVLACTRTLYDAMSRAVNEWPKAAAHHLTDDGENRRAWLGWAACGISRNVPAHLTRSAWWQLTEIQRDAANAVADQVIAEYHRAETLPF
jgi:hypothetical protein